jgi:putative alpha-1,2-mannosidase
MQFKLTMMNAIKRLLASMLILLGISAFAQQKQPVDYADPLLGTSESRWMLTPGPTLPFGMVQLSPYNKAQNLNAGYVYNICIIF